jgi:hypothetical protein
VVHNLELALHFGDLVLQRRSLSMTRVGCSRATARIQLARNSAHTARACSSRMQLAHAARACSSRMQLASAESCWLLAYGSRRAQRTCDSMRFFE